MEASNKEFNLEDIEELTLGDLDMDDEISDLSDIEDFDGTGDLELEEDEREYEDGTPVEPSSLIDEEEYVENTEFISTTGDVVVMDNKESEDIFDIAYIEIDKIGVSKRIRQGKGVDDLVRSIRSTGLLQPLVVVPTATEGFYVLIDGYRRLLACAKAGKRKIPCIVNNKISTPEIPVIEAMYNHKKTYTIAEIVEYIDYLEKEKGIMSASMIEYLLQLNSGDYTKLKDLLNDDDEEIMEKLYDGTYTIEQAFKKLEQRRRKESREEKMNKTAEKVYADEEESGADKIAGLGEEAGDVALTDEEIGELAINPDELDDGLEDESLDDMAKKGKETPGFEDHKQKVGQREFIDPAIKKAVLARDNFTCACCKRGGQAWVDVLDFHHIVPVHLGGSDTVDNGITACLTDHHLIHLYSTGDLTLPKTKTPEELEKMTEQEVAIYEDEQMRFKRIVKLGQVIRDGMAKKGIKRKEYKKEHPNVKIGRKMPGGKQQIS